MKQTKKNGIVAVLLMCCAAYCCAYMTRTTMSVLANALNESNVLTTSQYGIVSSLFFAVYAIGRVINGNLSDHVKPSIMIGVGVLVSGICNMIIGFFPYAVVIYPFWTINAVALSMPWSSIIIAAVGSAPEEKKGLYAACATNSCSLGNVLGIILASKSCAFYGLGAGFIVPGAITLIVGFVVLCLLKTEWKPQEGNVSLKVFADMPKLLKNKSILSLFLAFMANGVLKDSISIWLVSYVITRFEVDISNISGYVFFVPVVGATSGFLFPVFLKLFKGEEMKVSAVMYAISMVAVIPLCLGVCGLTGSIICFSVIFGLVHISNMSSIGIFPTRFESIGQTGSVCGLVDCLIYLGSALSSLIYGFVVEKSGFGAMFWSWLAIMLIAFVVLVGYQRKQR